jgi:hypothetical protein
VPTQCRTWCRFQKPENSKPQIPPIWILVSKQMLVFRKLMMNQKGKKNAKKNVNRIACALGII